MGLSISGSILIAILDQLRDEMVQLIAHPGSYDGVGHWMEK